MRTEESPMAGSDPKPRYLERPWLRFYPPGVAPTLPVPEQSVPQGFDEATDRFRDKTALVFYGRKLSFGELRDQVDRFAAALADLGVRPGDTVALYLLNSPQFVIAYFAALKAGARVTAISPVYTSFEIRHQLTDSGASVLVCQDLLHEKVERAGVKLEHVIVTNVGEYLPAVKKALGRTVLGRLFRGLEVPSAPVPAGVLQFQEVLRRAPARPPAVSIDPARDVAVLPYTGGTTGHPKGVVLTHRNLAACQVQARAMTPFEEGREVLLAFLPFFHIYGQVVLMLNGIAHGQTLVLFTTPDLDAILDAVEAYQATAFYGVPTLYEVLKDHAKTDRVNWKRLKVIGCGADTLHASTVEGWERRTGARILEGYGLTECSAVSHVNPYTRPKVGSFGLPLPNMGAAVVDPDGLAFVPPGEVGELVLSGPNVMQGYWNRPEDTAATLVQLDGERWLRTGDLVRMDDEGYFHYVDRRKDLIKYKGYSVFARDIEDVLYGHPAVKAAGVIGVPDPAVGAQIKAVVVLQPEARGKVTEDEVRRYCAERLAHYKVPKLIEFRGELPKTDVGKVSRRELREEIDEVHGV
jgi:long-chain acyl-CoA synthetase